MYVYMYIRMISCHWFAASGSNYWWPPSLGGWTEAVQTIHNREEVGWLSVRRDLSYLRELQIIRFFDMPIGVLFHSWLVQGTKDCNGRTVRCLTGTGAP